MHDLRILDFVVSSLSLQTIARGNLRELEAIRATDRRSIAVAVTMARVKPSKVISVGAANRGVTRLY